MSRQIRPCLALVLSPLLVLGCGKEDSNSAFTGSDSQGATNGASADGSDADSISTDAGDESNDGAEKLDVIGGDGGDGDGDGGAQEGCRAVDFLFVIDNSGSMGDEQSALVSSFPKFIDAINDNLDVQQDYHIMVTDVDAWQFADCADFLCELGGGLFCGPLLTGPEFTCDDPNPPEIDPTTPEVCEDVLGAGIIDPKGIGSSGPACNFASGARYIDKSEPDVKGAFECAARVGTSSLDEPERPMEAMVAAVGAGGEVAQCNAGFLRDDAILVVTFITDEDDTSEKSAGTPDGWKTALMAAKNLDETAIVVLGVFGGLGGCDAESSVRLEEFVSSFGPRGFHGDICASSYESFFLDAVETIQTTCEDFVPPAE